MHNLHNMHNMPIWQYGNTRNVHNMHNMHNMNNMLNMHNMHNMPNVQTNRQYPQLSILSPIGDLKYPIGDWGYMSLVAQSQRTISNPKLDKIKPIGDFIPNWVFYSVIPLL